MTMGFKQFPSDHPGFHASFDTNKRRFYRRTCLIPDGTRVPGCPCTGDKQVREFDGFFHLRDIYNFVEETRFEPSTVAFDDIWYNSQYAGNREDEIENNDDRFQSADISFPGIITPIKNPDNKPFRMLDGRRRLWKQQEAGGKEGLFYVLPEEKVFDFFWMILSLESSMEDMKKNR
jgi:hypothetical protein